MIYLPNILMPLMVFSGYAAPPKVHNSITSDLVEPPKVHTFIASGSVKTSSNNPKILEALSISNRTTVKEMKETDRKHVSLITTMEPIKKSKSEAIKSLKKTNVVEASKKMKMDKVSLTIVNLMESTTTMKPMNSIGTTILKISYNISNGKLGSKKKSKPAIKLTKGTNTVTNIPDEMASMGSSSNPKEISDSTFYSKEEEVTEMYSVTDSSTYDDDMVKFRELDMDVEATKTKLLRVKNNQSNSAIPVDSKTNLTESFKNITYSQSNGSEEIPSGIGDLSDVKDKSTDLEIHN